MCVAIPNRHNQFSTITKKLQKYTTLKELIRICKMNMDYKVPLVLFTTGIIFIYRVSQEECARLWEGVHVKVYRYNPKHLCPKLNGYGDNGQRSVVFLRVHALYVSWQSYPFPSLSVVSYDANSAQASHWTAHVFPSGWYVVQVTVAL